MRKKAIVFLLVLLSIASISAENLQKVYTTRDSIYKRVEALCSQAGVIGPSSFSPMPARALIIALDRINPETLSQAEIKEYNELYSILTGEDHLVQEEYFTFDIKAGANLGFNIADYSDFNYGHTNSVTEEKTL